MTIRRVLPILVASALALGACGNDDAIDATGAERDRDTTVDDSSADPGDGSDVAAASRLRSAEPAVR